MRVKEVYNNLMNNYGWIILSIWSFVIVYLSIMDILTTRIGIVMGYGIEGNPIVRGLLSYGFYNYLWLKIVGTVCIIGGVWFLYFRRWEGWLIVILILLIYGFLLGAFLNNAMVLKDFVGSCKDGLRLLDLYKCLFTLTILVLASLDDLKTRTVEDIYWIALSLVAVPVNVEAYLLDHTIFSIEWILIQIVVVFLVVLIARGLVFFGEADMKAILCLLVMFPYYPKIFDWVVESPCFVLTVLVNTGIPLIGLILFFLLRNLNKGDISKCMFFGYKTSVDKIGKYHVLMGDWESHEWKCSLKFRVVTPQLLKDLKKLGIREVWVSPLLPYIVFITIGYVIAICMGDIYVFLINILKK